MSEISSAQPKRPMTFNELKNCPRCYRRKIGKIVKTKIPGIQDLSLTEKKLQEKR